MLPCWLGSVLVGSGWKWAGGAEWVSPHLPSPGLACGFPSPAAVLFIPLAHGAGISSEGRHCPLLDPERTVANVGNAIPEIHHLSALPASFFSFDQPQEFNRTCLLNRSVLGRQNDLIQSVVLAKLLKQGPHLLTHQQGYF